MSELLKKKYLGEMKTALKKIELNEEVDELLRDGNFVQATKVLKELLKIDSNEINSIRNLIYCLYRLGKYKEALEYVNKILQINPADNKTLINKSRILYKIKKFRKAINTLLKIKGEKYDLSKNLLLMDCYYEIKKYSKVIKISNSLLKYKLDKDQKHYILETRALSLIEKKEFDDALILFRKIVKLDPQCITSLGNIGWILSKNKKNEQALKYFEMVLKIDSKDKKALNYYFKNLENLEKPSQIIIQINKLIKIEAHDNVLSSVLWTHKAELLFKLKNFRQTIISCDKAIKYNPKHICPYIVKIITLMKLKKYYLASETVNKAYKIGVGERYQVKKLNSLKRTLLKKLEGEK